MNGEYIRQTPDYELVDMLRPYLVGAGLVTQLFINTRWDYMMKFVALMKERCRLLTDFAELGPYFFHDKFEYEEKGINKHFSEPAVRGWLQQWLRMLEKSEPFTHEKLYEELKMLAGKLEIKPAKLIHPTRLALSGMTKGPSLFEMMELLGREECTSRIDRAIKYLDK